MTPWPASHYPGWPGLGDHGDVYPGRVQTNTGLNHLTSNTSLLVIVLHRVEVTYFVSHGPSITQKVLDNIWHCVWHWGCWHWSLDRARWPWHWPGTRGCGHTGLGWWRARDNGIISVMRRHTLRRRGSVLDETGAGHHRVNTDHHDTLRVKQMFELTQIYSIKDKYSAIHSFHYFIEFYLKVSRMLSEQISRSLDGSLWSGWPLALWLQPLNWDTGASACKFYSKESKFLVIKSDRNLCWWQVPGWG